MSEWLAKYESVWLFWILASELFVGLCTLGILLVEYYYDKSVIESKSRKRKRTKNRVTVKIDKDGQATITEAPKDVTVNVEHCSKDE